MRGRLPLYQQAPGKLGKSDEAFPKRLPAHSVSNGSFMHEQTDPWDNQLSLHRGPRVLRPPMMLKPHHLSGEGGRVDELPMDVA